MSERQKMWLKPDKRDDSLGSIWEYAISVNGYDYAQQNLKVKCGDLANSRLENFHRTCCWQGSFEELRCCLFFEQRRCHHTCYDPSGKDLAAGKALYWT